MAVYMPICGLPTRDLWPNSCNLNLYSDGTMSVGWHADNERLFQATLRDTRIISVSLGATRTFELRLGAPAGRRLSRAAYRMRLSDGDVCTMEGLTQKYYQHRVPPDSSTGPRINLTWRWILPIVSPTATALPGAVRSPLTLGPSICSSSFPDNHDRGTAAAGQAPQADADHAPPSRSAGGPQAQCANVGALDSSAANAAGHQLGGTTLPTAAGPPAFHSADAASRDTAVGPGLDAYARDRMGHAGAWATLAVPRGSDTTTAALASDADSGSTQHPAQADGCPGSQGASSRQVLAQGAFGHEGRPGVPARRASEPPGPRARVAALGSLPPVTDASSAGTANKVSPAALGSCTTSGPPNAFGASAGAMRPSAKGPEKPGPPASGDSASLLPAPDSGVASSRPAEGVPSGLSLPLFSRLVATVKRLNRANSAVKRRWEQYCDAVSPGSRSPLLMEYGLLHAFVTHEVPSMQGRSLPAAPPRVARSRSDRPTISGLSASSPARTADPDSAQGVGSARRAPPPPSAKSHAKLRWRLVPPYPHGDPLHAGPSGPRALGRPSATRGAALAHFRCLPGLPRLLHRFFPIPAAPSQGDTETPPPGLRVIGLRVIWPRSRFRMGRPALPAPPSVSAARSSTSPAAAHPLCDKLVAPCDASQDVKAPARP